MFNEVLKVTPKLDTAGAANLERGLNNRLKNVSKKFGAALKISAVAGLGAAFVSQILNPLNEVKGIIKNTVTKADDIATYSAQFNTTPEKLAKLQAFGQLKGLEPDSLYTLLNKFQGAVADAKADPTKPSSVRAYVNNPDTAAAFTEFIQSLQKMNPIEQNLVQKQVFGEKQILKMSEFLQANFKTMATELNSVNWKNVGTAISSLEAIEGYQKLKEVQNGLNDLIGKSTVINTGTIDSESLATQLQNKRENKQIRDFRSINDLNNQIEEMKEMLRGTVTQLNESLPIIRQAMSRSISGWDMIVNLLPSARGFKYGNGKKE